MRDKLYDTDLSDAAWAIVEPLLRPARPGGRPRTTYLRSVLDAILYLLRTGCQWRLLPREYPPWSTVHHYFRSWRNTGGHGARIDCPSAEIPTPSGVRRCGRTSGVRIPACG